MNITNRISGTAQPWYWPISTRAFWLLVTSTREMGLSQVSRFCLFHRSFVSSTAQHHCSSPDENSMGKALWSSHTVFMGPKTTEAAALLVFTCLQIQVTWANDASLFFMPSFTSDVHQWILKLHLTGIYHLLATTHSICFRLWMWPSPIPCSLRLVEGTMQTLQTGASNKMLQFPVHCTFRFFPAASPLHDRSRHKVMISYLCSLFNPDSKTLFYFPSNQTLSPDPQISPSTSVASSSCAATTGADWDHSSQCLWFHQVCHSVFQKHPKSVSLLRICV